MECASAASYAHLHSLPDEVLHIVLTLLDQRSLRSYKAVCRVAVNPARRALLCPLRRCLAFTIAFTSRSKLCGDMLSSLLRDGVGTPADAIAGMESWPAGALRPLPTGRAGHAERVLWFLFDPPMLHHARWLLDELASWTDVRKACVVAASFHIADGVGRLQLADIARCLEGWERVEQAAELLHCWCTLSDAVPLPHWTGVASNAVAAQATETWAEVRGAAAHKISCEVLTVALSHSHPPHCTVPDEYAPSRCAAGVHRHGRQRRGTAAAALGAGALSTGAARLQRQARLRTGPPSGRGAARRGGRRMH